ncbi:hypothetical protein [Kitasatospora sp. NBC_01302]|uniref:hypothetical protein n=1 Tax=Kitasatospora sp. NBC_01302 TaxID=2903575 RepID=UPI003FA3D1BC
MTTSTAIPTARQRKSRTRTTNVSSKPPLLVSQLPPARVQLTHRAEVLACPACDTWCPLTLDKGTKRWKVSPHHTAKAGTPGARRCGNSNRLVVIDVTLVRLQEQQVEASEGLARLELGALVVLPGLGVGEDAPAPGGVQRVELPVEDLGSGLIRA